MTVLNLIEAGTRLRAFDLVEAFGVERYKAFRRGAADPVLAEYSSLPHVNAMCAYGRHQFKKLPAEASFLAHLSVVANVCYKYQRVNVKLEENTLFPVYVVTSEAVPEYSPAQLAYFTR
jgi:hypothetical protein